MRSVRRAAFDARLVLWLGGGVLLCAAAVAVPYQLGREQGIAEARARPALSIPEDPAAWMTPGPEMLALGAETFRVNCASCHGPEGFGDGAAGKMLTPGPRNFHGPLDDWKNGWELKSIRGTLGSGIGKMPPFPALSVKEKFAVAHHIRESFLGERIAENETEDVAP